MNSECQHLHLKKCVVGETSFYKCSNAWVSVEDRLPEKGKVVLVYCEDGLIEAMSYFPDADDTDNWYEQDGDWYGNIPKFWQPLPAPPDESCKRNFKAEPLQIKVTYPVANCTAFDPEPCGKDERCQP